MVTELVTSQVAPQRQRPQSLVAAQHLALLAQMHQLDSLLPSRPFLAVAKKWDFAQRLVKKLALGLCSRWKLEWNQAHSLLDHLTQSKLRIKSF